MNNALQVRYVKLHFTIQFPENCRLPLNKVSALRGGMGEMLLRVNCIKNRDCENCGFESECIVQRIMYARFEKKPYFVTTGESVGYVLECENYREEFQKGDTLDFQMILFGKTIVYLNQMVQAFHMLGLEGIGKNHAKFRILSITNTKKHQLLEGNNIYMSQYQVSTLQEYVDYRLRQIKYTELENEIVFKTPLTLKYKGEFLQEFQMQAILEGVLRRIYMLDCFEGIEENILEYKFEKIPNIIEQTVRHAQVRRYSNRQREGMLLKGIEGKISLDEIDERILPVLLAGELIHVGKNSRFGFGRFRVS